MVNCCDVCMQGLIQRDVQGDSSIWHQSGQIEPKNLKVMLVQAEISSVMHKFTF
jgi:hypothetical protein